METITSKIEPLLQRAEEYGKSSVELLKLKYVDKTADVSSTLISRVLLIAILTVFLLTLSIAAALWLGDLLCKNYYGFLVVASFYGLIAIILYLAHPYIKTRLNNSIVKQMLN